MKFCLIFQVAILLLGCSRSSGQDPQRSFCYWKTSFGIDSTDKAEIKSKEISHLYLRLFDVDWDPVSNNPVPKGECSYNYYMDTLINITPVVFITNTVFENIREEGLEDLALKISRKTEVHLKDLNFRFLEASIQRNPVYIALQNQTDWNYSEMERVKDSLKEILLPAIVQKNREILFDCDWTVSTKAKYFRFLELIKTYMSGNEISSTIRLWQFRDYKLSGVPPVKRGLLMCYNLSDPRKYESTNSIATYEEFAKYITHSKYPLDLDIALPLHTWAVYFRANLFKGIVNGITEEDLKSNPSLFKPISDNRFEFQKDTVIQDTYYRYGDVFRVEQVDFKTLLNFAGLIKQHIKIDGNTRISFFSWDPKFYNRLNKNEYDQIFKTLSR